MSIFISPMHTADECAHRILDLLSQREIAPNHRLYPAALSLLFTDEGWTSNDLKLGLTYALANGWLEEDSTMIILTKCGRRQCVEAFTTPERSNPRDSPLH